MDHREKEYLELLNKKFDESAFIDFVRDLLNLNQFDISNNIEERKDVPKQYQENIDYYKYIAKYNDGINNIGILIVKLGNKTSTNARTAQRNFIATILSKYDLDASLVAFYSDKENNWRLSFVKKEIDFTDKGFTISLSPAKRFSYLVGENESVHTAKEYLLKLLKINDRKINIDDIEQVFDVEKVTKRFFEEYKEKYLQLKEYLDNNDEFLSESKKADFNSVEFAKKLMGQIVFLYFLQKKGWLGVQLVPNKISISEFNELLSNNDIVSQNVLNMFYELKDDYYVIERTKLRLSELEEDIVNLSNIFKNTKYDMAWGTGEKDFIRSIYKQAIKEHKNFFDDYLEPFFYKGLNEKRDNQYFTLFNCKIPFLNGGLFEPINNYRWSSAHFSIPNTLFSNSEKDGILDFLDLYNFTIDEEEPLEKDIAVDPEMLGKIFENLLEIDDRKSKGAFYTPRDIVYYMCQESIANYLSAKTGVGYNDIMEFIKYGDLITQLDWEKHINDDRNFHLKQTIFEHILDIDKALLDVKIADPAVGSGAFPLGMLNEIVKIRDNLSIYMLIQNDLKIIDLDSIHNTEQGKRELFDMKLQTIENSIYAVDIEPSAVDITKLRLWLSLIVDYPNNEEPKPLPNLDCKIMQGNSLVDEYDGISLFDSRILDNHLKNYPRKQNQETVKSVRVQFNLFSDETNLDYQMKQLIKYQKELFTTSDSNRKKELKSKIEKIQHEMIVLSLGNDTKKIKEITNAFKKHKKEWFIWKLEFYDVFKNDHGFDIVIGNPPYGAKLTKYEKNFLRKQYPTVADYESANYFIMMSKSIMKQNGILSFIVPNMFMANVNAKKFRESLLNEWNIMRVDNFSDYSIFESANVRNCIIFLRNIKTKTNKCLFTKMSYNKTLSIDKSKNYSDNDLNERIDNWLGILDENEEVKAILKKIKSEALPLEKFALDISQGLIPYDKYRGHTEEQIKNKVWNANYKKDETYKKELRGRDLKRYSLTWNGIDWISYGNWLAAPRKKEFFTERRILIREITNPRIYATITEEEYYNTPSIINCINFQIDPYYILGIINSKLMTYYHVFSSPKSNKGMFPKILVTDVRKLPIVVPDDETINYLSTLVKENLKSFNKDIDNKIDQKVYQIYQLNENEINCIETFFKNM